MGNNSRNMDINVTTHVGDTKEIIAIADALDDVAKSGDHVAPVAAALSKELRGLAKQQSLIDEFSKLSKDLDELQPALDAAKQKAEELGQGMSGQMTKEMLAAQKEVESLTKKLNKKQVALDKTRTAMTAASVDVNRLSDEEARLSESIQRVAAEAAHAAQMGDIRKMLDIPSHEAVNAEIAKLRAGYDELREKGGLTFAESAQAAQNLDAKIRELEKSTSNWTGALKDAKSELIKAAAASAGIVMATRAAADYESTMANIAVITSGTTEEVAQLGEELKQLSTELPLTIDQLATIAATGGELGVPINKMREFALVAGQMSAAFGMTESEIGDAIGKIEHAFDIPVEKTRELADVISRAGDQAGMAESKITQLTQSTAANAREVGLTYQQTVALGTAFLKAGMGADSASGAMGKMLFTLQKFNANDEGTQSTFKRLGIDAYQFAETLKAEPHQAVLELLTALDKLDEKSRAEIMSQMFGKAAKNIQLVVRQLPVYNQLLAELNDETKTANSLQERYNRVAETANAQLKTLRNSTQAAAITLGQLFLPVLKDMAAGLQTGTEAITKFVQEYPNISKIAAVLVATAVAANGLKVAFLAAKVAGIGMTGTIVKAGAAAMVAGTGFKGMAASINAASKAMGKLNVALIGLQVLFAAYEFGTWARENFKPVSDAGYHIAEAFALVIENLEETHEAARLVLALDWEGATKAVSRLGEKSKQIHQDFKELRDGYKTSAQEMAESQQRVNEKLAETEKALKSLESEPLAIVGTEEAQQKIAGIKAELEALKKEEQASDAAEQKQREEKINKLHGQLAAFTAEAQKQAAEQQKFIDDGIAKTANSATAFLSELSNARSSAQSVLDQFKTGISKVKSEDLPDLARGIATAFDDGDKSAAATIQSLQFRLKNLRDAAANHTGVVREQLRAQMADTKQELDALLAKQQEAADRVSAANAQAAKTYLDRLGLDGEKMLGLVSDAGKDAVGAFEAVSLSIDQIGLTAEQQAEVIRQSLNKALDTARSQGDIDLLNEKIKSLGDGGKLSGKQMTDALELTRRKSVQLQQDLSGAEEAFAQLGIKSQKLQQQELEKTRQAYEKVRREVAAGRATTEDENAAFLAYSQAVVQAGDNATTAVGKQQAAQQRELLRTRANVKGLREEYERLNGTINQDSGDAGSEGLHRLSDGVDGVRGKTKQAGSDFQKMIAGFGKGAEETSDKVKTSANDASESVAKGAQEATRMVTKAVGQAAEELGNLSQTALQSFAGLNPEFGQWMGIAEKTTELEALQGQIDKTRMEIDDLQNAAAKFGDTGESFSVAIKHQTIQVLEQKMALAQTVQELKNLPPELGRAAISADELKKRFSLLDDADLSQLDSAVSSVNSQIDQLNSKTQSATDRLNSMADASMRASQSESERLMRERNAKLQEIKALEKDGDAAAARRARGAVQREYESQQREIQRKESDRKKQEEKKTVNMKIETPSGNQKELEMPEKSVPVFKDFTRDLMKELTDLKKRGAGR